MARKHGIAAYHRTCYSTSNVHSRVPVRSFSKMLTIPSTCLSGFLGRCKTSRLPNALYCSRPEPRRWLHRLRIFSQPMRLSMRLHVHSGKSPFVSPMLPVHVTIHHALYGTARCGVMYAVSQEEVNKKTWIIGIPRDRRSLQPAKSCCF